MVPLGVCVIVAVGVLVMVLVGVCVHVPVGVIVGVFVIVGVGVGVCVIVFVGVFVIVGVGVFVIVFVGVFVIVGVGTIFTPIVVLVSPILKTFSESFTVQFAFDGFIRTLYPKILYVVPELNPVILTVPSLPILYVLPGPETLQYP